MDCSPPGSSPGKNTGVGCHALLQEIFWTQGSNPRLLCLLHWQANSLPRVVFLLVLLLLLRLLILGIRVFPHHRVLRWGVSRLLGGNIFSTISSSWSLK